MKLTMWNPSKERIDDSIMISFITYINNNYNLDINNYIELYDWSITQSSNFWESIWKFSEIIHHSEYKQVVDDINKMPGANWFEGSKLNFCENLLRYKDDHIAIRYYREDGNKVFLSYKELYENVAGIASALRSIGIKKGDRVCGYLPNIPEAVIAMLATASIGAIWSSCSPEFGTQGVVDRFKQIEPKIIFASNGYKYGGKVYNNSERIKEIVSQISTIKKVIIIPTISDSSLPILSKSIMWENFINNLETEINFEILPFDHPLYIMYSSGTTGLPKSIVHSAGGTLIQHLKELQLHTNVKRSDKIFYFTTCGWMMWNWLVSSLALGATIILYDGNPFYPDGSILHRLSHEWGITIFGTSAKYISSLESAGIKPIETFSFPHLHTILSTGSPLVDNNFDYVYNYWKKDVQLSSISGGTDIISCFALGNPLLPVYKGELQCLGLGMKVESFDKDGKPLINEKGELVCTQAFPSMPIYFWNDKMGKKYNKAYFNTYTKYWHHGDYLKINERGGVKIYGRSDTTLNPNGVRIGTSEIYQIIDRIPKIEDSLVVGQKWKNDERIILFIKLCNNQSLTQDFDNYIKKIIKESCTPRHVPSKIIQVDTIPYTMNGKKVELAVKQIIENKVVDNKESLSNPESLDYYKKISHLLI